MRESYIILLQQNRCLFLGWPACVCMCARASAYNYIASSPVLLTHWLFARRSNVYWNSEKATIFAVYAEYLPINCNNTIMEIFVCFFFNSSHRCVRKHVAYASIFATPVVRIDVSSFIWMFYLNLSEHRYYTLVYPLGRRQAQLIIIQIVCTRKWNKSEKK